MDGTPGRVRTCDLRLRSPLLYPAELPGRNGVLYGAKAAIDYSIGTKGIIADSECSFWFQSER